MKKEEVEGGATYSARVGGRTADVRIESVNAKGGWNAVAVGSGKPVRLKEARQILGPAGAAEPSGDGGGADRRPSPACSSTTGTRTPSAT